ncbi:MAG TPA: NF038122 family metalloprotease [Blastocatellia bacterium]|nr:NF038122 family metalloprotease [Blastocatellia bacterium]
MKSKLRHPGTGMRSLLLLIVAGCLLAAGLAGGDVRPASAARHAAPQTDAPLIQELRADAPRPAAQSQGQLQFTPLEGGTVLELRDGQMSCRAATAEEAQTMQRDPHQELHALSEEALAAASPEPVRNGLKIILRGTAQLEQYPEAKAAFLRAARTWESLIQNPITVVIDVDFGPTSFVGPFGENQYGYTRFQRGFAANYYPTLRSILMRSAGSPQEAALYNALPAEQLPTDLGAATRVIYHVAPLRALGAYQPVADPERENLGLPPGIAFNSAYSFDFDPSDGIKPKRVDFQAAALHEIGHALGFFSSVGYTEEFPGSPPSPDILDLFRFRPGVGLETFAAAPRTLSSGGEHVFFGGGPELALSTGRSNYTGGDGQQAGHWKDELFTGRYIGIMSPTFARGLHYEMTANDIEAFERIGYRMNPLPSAREAELKLDEGTMDTGALRDGALIVNRLTPPSYPATLRKLRILIPLLQNEPDPAGRPITLLIGTQNNPNGQPPPGAQFRRIETTVPSASADLFLEFPIPDGPTISSGDFFVGYQAPTPRQGVGFAVDFGGSAESRSFYSSTNGEGYALLSAFYQGRAANAMIRALVSIGVPTPPPTPTPIPTPTPGPDTVALASGAPQDGYTAASSPAGKAFGTQYTIQVPSGATELKVNLSANTDLDLYARFGSRVALQNGFVVADFKSVSDDYSESITITPGSSPALQAGVYYLMVVNYGPGPSTFRITATVNGGSGPTQGRVVSVSAASYSAGGLASEAIAAAFGTRLATSVMTASGTPDCPNCLPTELAGTRVLVKDSAGTERPAPLFFVSPGQVNYLIPAGTAAGTATVAVTSGDGTPSVGTAQIAAVAPGLFSANGDGGGVPAAAALRVRANGQQSYEPVARFDSAQGRFVPQPLDLNTAADEVFLVLFATGLRHHQGLSSVSVRIGGVEAPVLYAGPQQYFVGLDQINVRLPRSLSGRGELDLVLTADGREANHVRIHVR